MALFGSSYQKPYTAVTVSIDHLTGGSYDEGDLSGLVDLIEVIRIQDSGPTEAARAIRKKLKYGDAHRQLRALTILDALMQNAGPRFQKRFADEPLLERLRILPTDDMVDIEVRQKCNQLYRGWAQTYKDTPGMQSIAALHKQLPKKQRPAASQSKVIRETEREALENPFGTEEELERAGAPTASQGGMSTMPATPPPGSRRTSVAAGASSTPSSPATSSHQRTPSKSTSTSTADPDYASGGGIWGHYTRKSKHKHSSSTSSNKGGQEAFSLEREKPAMLSSIANASVASTNLLNSMRHLNRETSRVSEDAECVKRFETCKALRRQILRYIQLVESEQWIGSLLNANDELVKALIAYEVADKSVDDDSDSEEETEMVNHESRGLVLRSRLGNDADDQQQPSSHAQGRRNSIKHPPPPAPPSAPQSRRTSLAEKGAAPPPPKPPRPSHLPPATSATSGYTAAGALDAAQHNKRHSEHLHPQPTPISEGNEDDPFGDRNAF